ncbi:2-hydroxymuconate tautomerase family protein [Malaciobacter marinus]|jgi:4-oxalocrotonate tautomerase|uniref:Tautomerase n=1 Tax=Malaciobacter marinus TaxID=505249 RepID=A0AB36ZTT2_9BACT|nr:2-hydroxymuconate tautomerase family protein [Malaciobacter marinus]PPK60209.1 4-oxalocrotonate tautomerase [Malaciobacter marinus]SKB40136.1 4-oxalocrotonate tautomerase [Malaciobacter marinus]
MPIISVKMTHEDGGATKEQKEILSKKLTQSFQEVFNRKINNAVVIIEEVSTDNYAIGGETVSNIRKIKA